MTNKKTKTDYNPVYIISLITTLAVVVFALAFPDAFESSMNSALSFITAKFGWYYLIVMLAFVIFPVGFAFSKYGNIKLGPDDSEPEHANTTWFAMLFGAGMGIGLVFWGVAEPLNHFINPATGIESASAEALAFSMEKSFLHWGFHAWATYSIIGLSLAYFQFRKGKPGLISSIFIPILGEDRVNGPIGKLIDILAVFATVAGVATSLGMGVMQITAGLEHVFNLNISQVMQVVITLIITVIFIWTAISGIDKGISMLSDINLGLCIIILLGVFLVGPKIFTLKNLTNSFGAYINNFFSNSLGINPLEDDSWLSSWTIFYYAWWVAWGPFVGTFIARISKGRTIREFVLGVIMVPSLVSFLWFAIFGSAGLNLNVDIIKTAITNTETALFVVLAEYPFGSVLSVIAIALLFTFFITSANSATFVLGSLTSRGDENPSKKKLIIWGVVQSALAIVLMLRGGLNALQTCSIVVAFPFTVIILMACVSMLKEFLSLSDEEIETARKINSKNKLKK